MIELDPAVVIILSEALLILILLALIIPFMARKKNSVAHDAAQTLIKKLEKNQGDRTGQLEHMMQNFTCLQSDQTESLLEEITGKEKQFYQYILRMFFNRDTELLKKIDKLIQNYSEPYCKLLRFSATQSDNDDSLQHAQQEISRLKKENQRLSTQMDIVKHMMTEVSVEYAQIFGGSRTELELNNSSKKIMALLNSDLQKLKQANPE